jgi:signal transduction histidine kinase
VGYGAVASPITSEDARVGVVILLVESSAAEERLRALQREFAEPVGELRRVLDELLEQAAGRRDVRQRTLLEDGSRALARVQKWCDELTALVAGPPAGARPDAGFDAVRVVQAVADGLRGEFAARGVPLEVLAPAQLPRVRGDAARVEVALACLLRDRLAAAGGSASVTLAVRVAGRGEQRWAVISVSDAPSGEGASPASADARVPALVEQAVRALGGEIRTSADPLVGRTTAIRLELAGD